MLVTFLYTFINVIHVFLIDRLKHSNEANTQNEAVAFIVVIIKICHSIVKKKLFVSFQMRNSYLILDEYVSASLSLSPYVGVNSFLWMFLPPFAI